MSYYKEVYEVACDKLARKLSGNVELVRFIEAVDTGIGDNATKGYRIYGRDTAVDEVHMLAKSVGLEEGIVWSYLIRYFDDIGIEIKQTQYCVLFSIKDCI